MSALQQTLFDNGRWLKIRNQRRRVWKVQDVDNGIELYRCPGCVIDGCVLSAPHFAALAEFNETEQHRLLTRHSPSHCRRCRSLYSVEYSHRHPEYARNYMRRKRRRLHENLDREFFAYLQHGAKQRAKASGLEFDLPRDHLFDLARAHGFCCMVTGIPFRRASSKGRGLFHPSPDRIVSSVGYTTHNVHLVALGFNLLKNHHSNAEACEFLRLAAAGIG